MHIDEIKKIKDKYSKEWLSKKGVIAVGIGKTQDGQTGIVISVNGDHKKFRRDIPQEIDGVTIQLKLTEKPPGASSVITRPSVPTNLWTPRYGSRTVSSGPVGLLHMNRRTLVFSSNIALTAPASSLA